MTLVLDLKPETEETLRAEATRRGVDLPTLFEEFAAKLKNEHLDVVRPSKVSRGMLKGSGPTVDQFLSERNQEANQDTL